MSSFSITISSHIFMGISKYFVHKENYHFLSKPAHLTHLCAQAGLSANYDDDGDGDGDDIMIFLQITHFSMCPHRKILGSEGNKGVSKG